MDGAGISFAARDSVPPPGLVGVTNDVCDFKTGFVVLNFRLDSTIATLLVGTAVKVVTFGFTTAIAASTFSAKLVFWGKTSATELVAVGLVMMIFGTMGFGLATVFVATAGEFVTGRVTTGDGSIGGFGILMGPSEELTE